MLFPNANLSQRGNQMLFPNANLSQRGNQMLPPLRNYLARRGNQMLPPLRNYLARRGEFDSLLRGITSQGEGNLTPSLAELPRKERGI